LFERFTERARQVIVLASDEARELGHGYIGTEHLLLGLLREEVGIAARVLRTLGVETSTARERVEATIGRGQTTAATGQIPLTPPAKAALERSASEARDLGHAFVGTEHVLLALVAEPHVVAVEVLELFGLAAAEVREAVLAAFGGA
jgi:ATP-dependent Clp protease ATP-binding subunit ClpC